MLNQHRVKPALWIAAAAFALVLFSPAVAPRAEAEIGRANLDSTGVDQGFITTPVGASTLDVAVNADHVYWTWVSSEDGGGSYEGSIGRANLNGTGVEPKFITGVGYGGVAVSAGHIYWANSDAQTIGRANLDGTGVDRNFLAAAGERAFDVEVDADHVYWAWDSENGGGPRLGWIGRANLDGAGVNRDFIGPISFGSDLGLAVDASHIYWRAGLEVFRANLDGSGGPTCTVPVEPCTPAFLSVPVFDLAVDEAYVYFSGAWPVGHDLVEGIGRANLDGSDLDPFGFITGLSAPINLAVDANHIYWTGGPPDPPDPPDADPPETRITKGAPDRTHKHRVVFKFRSSEPDSSFECRLDRKPYKPCTSPRKVKRLDEGKHKFKVRATDAAGNVDPTAAKDKFKVVD